MSSHPTLYACSPNCLRFTRVRSLLDDAVPHPAHARQRGLTTLEAQRDRTRPLLIFAARPDDPQLEIQVRTLKEHAAEARERDIVAIALPYNNPSPTDLQLSSTDAEAARRRFHVAPNEFAVILLGKDGGEKLRAKKPISMERLEETIDAMPMRQDEMRAKPQRQ